jgi:hypothetical protein
MTLPPAEQAHAEKARELIAAVGGLDPASEYGGIGTSQLGRYQPKTDRDSMPSRVIEALESVTHGTPGHPVMTRHLARRQGFVLVPLPGAQPGESEWNRHVARLSKQAGAMIAAIATALADDQYVSPAEARDRLPTAHSLVTVAAEIEHALAARAAEGT